jgi:hypothetical protein
MFCMQRGLAPGLSEKGAGDNPSPSIILGKPTTPSLPNEPQIEPRPITNPVQ